MGGQDDETEAQAGIFGFVIRSRRRSLEFIVILDRVGEKGISEAKGSEVK
jgi:hypothetical protein